MGKRMPSNTVQSAVQRFADRSAQPPCVPAGTRLRQTDFPHWELLIASKPFSEWTPCQLRLAAEAVRCLSDLAEEQTKLDGEGFVIAVPSGRPRINPRAVAIDAMTSRLLALLRATDLIGSRVPKRAAVVDVEDYGDLIAR